jgi:hypothetical protein
MLFSVLVSYLMWNFIKGVNPPIKKRKTKARTLYNSEYDSSKRVRSYSTECKKIERG